MACMLVQLDFNDVSGMLSLGAPDHASDKAVQPCKSVLAVSLSFSDVNEIYM